MVEELFAQGQQTLGSGGVVGGLLSGALVPMCGSFGALMIYLACMILCAVVLWGVTVEGILRSLFPERERKKAERAERREQKEAERERRRLEHEWEREERAERAAEKKTSRHRPQDLSIDGEQPSPTPLQG